MEKPIYQLFLRAKHLLLIFVLTLFVIQGHAQSTWGFSAGYQYHPLIELGGLQGDVNFRIPIFKSTRVEMGMFYNISRGNHPDLRFDTGELLFQDIQKNNPITSFSNIWGFRAALARNIWKSNRSSIALGAGMHISYVKFNIIQQVDRVIVIQDFFTPELVDLPLPLVQHFIAYSFYVQAPYTFQVRENLQAVLTPYYADMRGFNGFWGVNLGIMIDI